MDLSNKIIKIKNFEIFFSLAKRKFLHVGDEEGDKRRRNVVENGIVDLDTGDELAFWTV